MNEEDIIKPDLENKKEWDYDWLEGIDPDETPNIWYRWKRETAPSYKKFIYYLQLGFNRSLDKVVMYYREIGQGNKGGIKDLFNTWSWYKRAVAYDNYQNECLRLTYKDKINNMIRKQIDNSIARIHINNINTKDIHEDDSLNSYQRAYALEANSRAYRRELESLFMLSGRPEKTIMQRSLSTNPNGSIKTPPTPKELDKKLQEKFRNLRKKAKNNATK